MKLYQKLPSKFKNEIHLNHTKHAPLDRILLQVASLRSIGLLVSIFYDIFFFNIFEVFLKYPMRIRKFGIFSVHLQNLVEILYF